MDAQGEIQGAAGRRLAYIEQEVRSQLAWRRRRRDRDRRTAFCLQLATVALSAVITVLLGVRVGDPLRAWLSGVALSLGALATVLAAWNSFYSHRELWLQRSDTVHRLGVLERQIAFYRAGLADSAPDPAEVERFRADSELIAELDHQSWTRVRRAQGTGSTLPDHPPAAGPDLLADPARGRCGAVVPPQQQQQQPSGA